MGKKSLFEPTIAPEQEKNEPMPEKTDNNKAATAAGRKPEPKVSKTQKTEAEVSPPIAEEPPFEAGITPPETDEPSFETDVSPFEDEAPPFEYDPLLDKKIVLSGTAGLCGLIIILLIASMINAGNYYVKQNRGAVEIWKGDFTPIGQDRILILHGTRWNRPVKDSYSMEAVFSFAAVYYLEKARALAEAPVSEDFDGVVYCLDRVLALFPDRQYQETATAINQARQYITEARILQASGEKEALSLAQEKINATGKVLTGLITEMSEDNPETEKAASGH